MKTKAAVIFSLFIIFVAFAASIFLYPSLPDIMASHWNMQGKVDGYMSKPLGAFLMPAVLILFLAIFLIIVRIDPLKQNIETFRSHYNLFMIMLILFLLYIHLLLLWWNSGHIFDMAAMIIPAAGVLFLYIGFLLGKSKRNWFVGIRTPWTMSSDVVWDKTHRLGKYLFIFAGICTIAGFFFREYAFFLMIGSVLVAAIVPVVYSYFAYRQENDSKHEK